MPSHHRLYMSPTQFLEKECVLLSVDNYASFSDSRTLYFFENPWNSRIVNDLVERVNRHAWKRYCNNNNNNNNNNIKTTVSKQCQKKCIAPTLYKLQFYRAINGPRLVRLLKQVGSDLKRVNFYMCPRGKKNSNLAKKEEEQENHSYTTFVVKQEEMLSSSSSDAISSDSCEERGENLA
jgi:hypothetical protein